MDEQLLKMAELMKIETKGKTELELMTAVSDKLNQKKTKVEEKSKNEDIENGAKQFPNVKKIFEKPFAVWLENVGKGKKPECLPVVGYNPKTSSVIVCKEAKSDAGEIDYKLFQVDEKLIITSLNRLNEINEKIKADRAAATAAARSAKDSGKPTTTKKSK